MMTILPLVPQPLCDWIDNDSNGTVDDLELPLWFMDFDDEFGNSDEVPNPAFQKICGGCRRRL